MYTNYIFKNSYIFYHLSSNSMSSVHTNLYLSLFFIVNCLSYDVLENVDKFKELRF